MAADDSDLWLVLGGIALGCLGLASGIAVRRGSLRYQLDDYWDEQRPVAYRSMALVQIPAGADFILVGLAWLLWTSADDVAALTALLASGGLTCAAATLVWLPSPPSFLKPSWLRAQEAERATPQQHSVEAIAWRLVSWSIAAILLTSALTAIAVAAIGIASD